MSRIRIIHLLVLLAGISSPFLNFANAQGELEPRIVNGLFTSDFPTTGALLFGGNPENATSWCSGTLIGCNTFLTAAHCVCDFTGQQCQGANAPDPDDYTVFLQHAGLFAVDSITIRPDYNFPDADVAIVKLDSAVNGIPPMPINTTQTPAFGTSGVIVGFGRSGGNNYDYGLKRHGNVTTDSCSFGISNTRSVCWRFEDPIGLPGTDSNTCNADSGGPLFIDFGEGDVVAGITSGGSGSSCLPSDRSFDTNVYHYRDWIKFVAGPDIQNSSCGVLPQLEVAADVTGFNGSVSGAAPEGRHVVNVPADTRILRVTMNSEDDGQDFDLYVKAGGPPGIADYDCARTGGGQYASCEFDPPVGGNWQILVQHVSGGAGKYQVTATAIPDIERGLTAVLSSDTHSVQAGGIYPFTLALSNDTVEASNFILTLSLILPNGVAIPLIPGKALTLPANASAAPNINLPLPAGFPSVTFGIGVSLTDQVSGLQVSESYLSFDIN